MSIIIKGTKMPENCHECPCLRHDSWDGFHRYQCNNTLIAFGWCDSWSYERRPDWCPLEEVVHGRWLDYDDDYGAYCCSVCEQDAPEDTEWSYCPHCGADMREDKP